MRGISLPLGQLQHFVDDLVVRAAERHSILIELAARDGGHDGGSADAWPLDLQLDLRQEIQVQWCLQQGSADTDIQQNPWAEDGRMNHHEDA